MQPASRLLGLSLLLLGASPALASDATLLPDARLDLSIARYSPSEQDFIWTGWIGGEMGLVARRSGRIALSGRVETILGSRDRAFEANQGNYHIDLTGTGRRGPTELAVFLHHVSRHELDRPRNGVAAWNIFGARASRRFPGPMLGRFVLTAGLGRVVQQTLVNYGWEATAQLTADLARPRWGEIYLDAAVRGVTAKASETMPRGGFADVRVEGGARWRRSRHAIEGFVALDHRHDVFLDRPGARTRALFGLRLGYAGGHAADPPVDSGSASSDGH